jgi:hypothetical protein
MYQLFATDGPGCRDYIFYFSYVHLPPEGNNLWSNADQLAAVNGKSPAPLLSFFAMSMLTHPAPQSPYSPTS